MPIHYIRQLTGAQRGAAGNRHLGIALAFIAGAANAGGFLAVHQYTSHMTGIVSSMADNLAMGAANLALDGLGALLSFLAGAASSAIMVNYARRHQLHSTYALPLLLEAALLLGFGVLGARLAQIDLLFIPVTVMLLCFTMGLQNAVITKLSNAEIRTTHITGLMTDIGIELGKMAYWNAAPGMPPVRADFARLRILLALAGAFFAGGVAGALSFTRIGYGATVILALLLVVLAIVPVADDALAAWRKLARQRGKPS